MDLNMPDDYTVRFRNLDFNSGSGAIVRTTQVPGQPATVSKGTYARTVRGAQTTASKNNHWRTLRRHIKRFGIEIDVGSGFASVSNDYRVNVPSWHVETKSGFTTKVFSGGLSPSGMSTVLPNTSAWPSITMPVEDNLVAKGATAISRCTPSNPEASVSQFLGELREGLPRAVGLAAWKHRGNPLVGAANENLNYQFGILPFVNDFRKFQEALDRADHRIDSVLRLNGMPIHRSYSFPVEETSEVIGVYPNSSMYPTIDTDMYANLTTAFKGDLTITKITTKSWWFDGCFRYYIPEADLRGLQSWIRTARTRFGIELNPRTLWNLTPWTWAVDWIGNVGDIINNFTNIGNDGLVLQYGYLMYNEVITNCYEHAGVSFKTGPTGPVVEEFITELKYRMRANPYGFGLSWEGLSPKQLAIAASLGLSKR